MGDLPEDPKRASYFFLFHVPRSQISKPHPCTAAAASLDFSIFTKVHPGVTEEAGFLKTTAVAVINVLIKLALTECKASFQHSPACQPHSNQ